MAPVRKGKRQMIKKTNIAPMSIDFNSAVSSLVNDKFKEMFGETSNDKTRSKRLNSEREMEEEEEETDNDDPPPSKVQKKMPSAPDTTQKDYATQVVILEGVNPELKKHPLKLSTAFKKCKPNVELRSDGMRLTASGDVLVKPKNPKDCNSLLKENAFPTQCDLGTNVRARVPKSQQLTHQVIIKNVDEEVTQEEMEEVLTRQELPFKTVKRIRSRARDAPTKMFRLILKDEITKKRLLKEGINLDMMHYKCVPAIEDTKEYSRVLQCFKCQEIGDHLSGSCTKEQKCVLCSGPHRKAECKAKREEYKCANCSGSHAAWSPECPRRQETQNKRKSSTFSQVASATVTPAFLKQTIQEIKESVVALVAEVVSRAISELVIDLLEKNLSKSTLPLKVASITKSAANAVNKLSFGPADEPIDGMAMKDKVVQKCFPSKTPPSESQNGASSST